VISPEITDPTHSLTRPGLRRSFTLGNFFEPGFSQRSSEDQDDPPKHEEKKIASMTKKRSRIAFEFLLGALPEIIATITKSPFWTRHADFVPNMIAAASQTDAALLMVDATNQLIRKGQTREHLLLC
jgi:hypothetical protein